MKHFNCDVCGLDDNKVLRKKNMFKIVKCSGCDLVYTTPRPSVSKQYNKDFFINEHKTYYSRSYEKDRESIVDFARKRMNEIEKYKRRGKLLDVGCALGFCLEVAKERGWKTYGVDISDYAVRYTREKLRLNVVKGNFLDVNFKKEFFDVVCMWLVLEHMTEPAKNLRKVNNILKRNGIFAIKLPNIGGFSGRFNLKWWLDNRPDNHYCDFTPRTIALMLEKTGFKILNYSTEGIHLNRVLNVLQSNSINKFAEESKENFEYLKKFYEYIAKIADLGDTVVVFAKKI